MLLNPAERNAEAQNLLLESFRPVNFDSCFSPKAHSRRGRPSLTAGGRRETGQRLGGGQSDHRSQQGSERPRQETVQSVAQIAILARGRSRAHEAREITAEPVTRKRCQDHIQSRQQNKRKRSVPPRRCRRADGQTDRQGEGMQHEGERCRRDASGNDWTPTRFQVA